MMIKVVAPALAGAHHQAAKMWVKSSKGCNLSLIDHQSKGTCRVSQGDELPPIGIAKQEHVDTMLCRRTLLKNIAECAWFY
jgi:hypothetical protein